MARPVSELSFVRRTHQLLSVRSLRRRSADFVPPVAEVFELAIDGVPLLDMVLERLPRFLLISPLHLGTGLLTFHALAMLGKGPSDVHESKPPGHIALLMCPHCVIGGCGVVSGRLSHEGRWTRWSEIGDGWPKLDGIGPFRFDTQQYESTLNALLDNAAATPTTTVAEPTDDEI